MDTQPEEKVNFCLGTRVMFYVSAGATESLVHLGQRMLVIVMGVAMEKPWLYLTIFSA